MKGRMAGIGIALVMAAAVFAAGAEKKGSKDTEPFYRKYLVRGAPLDDRIREQERRVEANPDSADLRNDFGNLLAARRFPEDARRQYEAALDLDRSQYLAAYNLGLLFETQGQTSKAISAYRKSIARKPGFPHSHFRLGRLYEHRGWERLAVREYAKALRLDPRMREARVNPLAVETRLLDRASLVNYPRDLAAASALEESVYVDAARFRRIPVDRPVSAEELGDAPAPEPIDATAAPATVLPSASAPPSVRGSRPAPVLVAPVPRGRPTEGPRRRPPPTPIPEPEPEPESEMEQLPPDIIIEPTPEPEPMPKEPPPPPPD